ncbi:hypothetical protein D3227_30240 [Mesorhizobium waimense]|uniref:Uncharacterized protein n=1 Tax=Mesorhizobium waimense TaxID=1300307 RepID=A0A3A5KHI4_9HYPH|nr:hypothetical protein D3227_30240 [Mesorhizobium waimense]
MSMERPRQMTFPNAKRSSCWKVKRDRQDFVEMACGQDLHQRYEGEGQRWIDQAARKSSAWAVLTPQAVRTRLVAATSAALSLAVAPSGRAKFRGELH